MSEEKKPRFITGEIVEEEDIIVPKKSEKSEPDKKNEENAKVVENFMSYLVENMQDLDPEYSRLVSEHFQELI